jgi:hypothetical protein
MNIRGALGKVLLAWQSYLVKWKGTGEIEKAPRDRSGSLGISHSDFMSGAFMYPSCRYDSVYLYSSSCATTGKEAEQKQQNDCADKGGNQADEVETAESPTKA